MTLYLSIIPDCVYRQNKTACTLNLMCKANRFGGSLKMPSKKMAIHWQTWTMPPGYPFLCPNCLRKGGDGLANPAAYAKSRGADESQVERGDKGITGKMGMTIIRAIFTGGYDVPGNHAPMQSKLSANGAVTSFRLKMRKRLLCDND